MLELVFQRVTVGKKRFNELIGSICSVPGALDMADYRAYL